MLKYLLLFSFTFCSLLCFSQITYDSTLAKKLNADDYGMKQYVLVILKTGSNISTEKKDSCFKQHLANISRLAKEDKLIVAGPIVGKNENQYRGIFILNVSKKEKAVELLKTDAAISEKYLDFELYEWYGSAALPTYLDNVDKVSKKKI